MSKNHRPILSLKAPGGFSGDNSVERRVPETIADPQNLGRVARYTPNHGDVILLDDHGFVTEIDAVYSKRAGTKITNPLEIAMLKSRGVRLKDA